MILGTDLVGWVEVFPQVPYGDAHTETRALESTSIMGRVTRNTLRFQRSWQVQTAPLDDRMMARLQVLRRAGGPYWLYDDTLADMAPRDTRLLRTWRNGSTLLVPQANLQLPIAAGVTATSDLTTVTDVTRLMRVVAGDVLTFGVTMQAVTGSSSVLWGARWYRADGTSIGPVQNTVTATTTATRFTATLTAPALAAYGMWTVAPSTAITLTAPSVLPGSGVDAGGGWFPVHLTDMTENHFNSALHSAALSLQET